MRRIGIWGDSDVARAYEVGAQELGWSATLSDRLERLEGLEGLDGLDVVRTAPIAGSLAEADAIVDTGGRLAFGWPLITTAPVQALLRRAAAVGSVTDLSSRSTRPTPSAFPPGGLLGATHDQIALTMLVARLVGHGAPQSVEASTTEVSDGVARSVDIDIGFRDGLIATVHADWLSDGVASQEFQLAGADGVLRFETDPAPALEFNGSAVALPAARVADQRQRPLHESGVVDMLKTIGAAFDSGALPHAFSLGFGRDVLDVLVAASVSASTQRLSTLPYDGDRTSVLR